MQVGTGNASRLANFPDFLTFFDGLTWFHINLAEVRIKGLQALAMVEENAVATEKEVSGFDKWCRWLVRKTGVPSGAAISNPPWGLRGLSLKKRLSPKALLRIPLTGRLNRVATTSSDQCCLARAILALSLWMRFISSSFGSTLRLFFIVSSLLRVVICLDLEAD